MKHLSLLFLLIFISVYPNALLHAESKDGNFYRIIKSNFLPPKSYVGDVVELRLTVETAEGKRIKLPARYSSSDRIKIKNIRIQPHSDSLTTVRIYFISYQTGTQALPVISLGDIALKNIQIYTNSLLTELKNSRFRGVKEQVVFPGTIARIVGVVLTVVLLPFILLFLFFKVKLWIQIITAERKRKKPYRVARVSLKKLKSNMENTKVKSFFTELSIIIRKYLQQRMELPFLSLTTDEIKKALIIKLNNESAVSKLTDILYRSDLIKFGGRKINHSEVAMYPDMVEKLIDDIEYFMEREVNVEP